jgi:hypothetical protein
MDRRKRAFARNGLLIETLEARQLLSASSDVIVSPSLVINADASKSSTTIEGYTPAQIKAAYGISSISFGAVSGTGAGETIAIVDAYSDPNISSDLTVFDKEFSLAVPPSFIQESATGSTTKLPAADAGWDGEISLDVEWAHAIAPQAKIILVDASSDSMSSLMAAVNYARNISTVSVVSMSWGGSEFSSESSYDQYFTTPSGHIGVTFVAASGDEGAAGGAEYPAASPNVLSVGGTTLTLSSTGSIASQTAWSDSSGGVSEYESTPAYQSGVKTSGRSTPDVSYDADPNTGFAVYDSVADEGYVGWQEVGGTSAGAPQWAALIAIADQGRAKNGLTTLTTTQTLDELYGVYANSTSYAADFSDITSGSSLISQGGGGGFGGPFGGRGGRGRTTVEVSATAGYDTLTGLGTPKATGLVGTLATANVSSSAVVKTANASITKTTKVKTTAAIEVRQFAPVFGIFVSRVPFLPIQRAQSNVEFEASAGSTAAATIAGSRSGTSGSITVGESTAAEQEQTSPAPGDPAEIGAGGLTAVAAAFSSPSSGRAAVALAEVGAAVVGSTESIPAGIFSDTAIARGFGDVLGKVGQTGAALPRGIKHGEPTSSSAAKLVAAAAMGTALIGYLAARKKQNASIGDLFNDQVIS